MACVDKLTYIFGSRIIWNRVLLLDFLDLVTLNTLVSRLRVTSLVWNSGDLRLLWLHKSLLRWPKCAMLLSSFLSTSLWRADSCLGVSCRLRQALLWDRRGSVVVLRRCRDLIERLLHVLDVDLHLERLCLWCVMILRNSRMRSWSIPVAVGMRTNIWARTRKMSPQILICEALRIVRTCSRIMLALLRRQRALIYFAYQDLVVLISRCRPAIALRASLVFNAAPVSMTSMAASSGICWLFSSMVLQD